MEWINEAGKVAGSISAILALLALILFKPIKAHIKVKQDKKRRELKQRYEMELEDRETAAEFRREMRDGMNKINQTLETLTDDIADLEYERLSQAYEYYMAQGWCPGSKKEMLCQMHKSYRAKGRMHLSEIFEEEIIRMNSKPRDQTT